MSIIDSAFGLLSRRGFLGVAATACAAVGLRRTASFLEASERKLTEATILLQHASGLGPGNIRMKVVNKAGAQNCLVWALGPNSYFQWNPSFVHPFVISRGEGFVMTLEGPDGRVQDTIQIQNHGHRIYVAGAMPMTPGSDFLTASSERMNLIFQVVRTPSCPILARPENGVSVARDAAISLHAPARSSGCTRKAAATDGPRV